MLELVSPVPRLALIREAECIGCTKCLEACPVDAIFGAVKKMHVVVQEDCIGCGLCIAPCPMDCIDLIPAERFHYHEAKAQRRYLAKQQRLSLKKKRVDGAAGFTPDASIKPSLLNSSEERKRFIAAAVQRAQAKQNR